MMPVTVKFMKAGTCTHPEAIVMRGGRWKTALFPALCVLISHPERGNFLFDTGYSSRFFEQTQSFPFQLYAWTTPVQLQAEDPAVQQLARHQIDRQSIRQVILSHFHADHISGLQDFPGARAICLHSAYAAVKAKRGFSALRAGYLAGLLPKDFEQSATFLHSSEQVPLPDCFAPFKAGFDLLGDGSLLAVILPGHAAGQLGLFLRDAERMYFLIADACWLRRAYEEERLPHPITNLIADDMESYAETLHNIHTLHQNNPNILIVPSHCLQTWSQLVALGCTYD